MNDYQHDADDPLADPLDTDPEADLTQVVIATPMQSQADDPYRLDWLFLRWAWGGGYGDWAVAVKALAQALRGLEQIGLVERRTIRRTGGAAHHGFVLTEDGRRALLALAGEWIDEPRLTAHRLRSTT